MPVKLTTTVKKIADIPNSTNSTLLSEFYQYMKSNGASDSHLNNNLKALSSLNKTIEWEKRRQQRYMNYRLCVWQCTEKLYATDIDVWSVSLGYSIGLTYRKGDNWHITWHDVETLHKDRYDIEAKSLNYKDLINLCADNWMKNLMKWFILLQISHSYYMLSSTPTRK